MIPVNAIRIVEILEIYDIMYYKTRDRR